MGDGLISYFKSDNYPVWIGVFYSILFFIFMNMVLLSWEHYWSKMTKMRLVCKASLMDAVYRKSERLQNEARVEFTSGKIMTIVTTDIGRVSGIIYCVNGL